MASGYTITSYSGTNITLSLPTTQDNIRIDAIGVSSVFQNKSLTSVIGDSISIIGDNAFQSCSNLMYASFKNCTVIGSSAFNGCNLLSSINFQKCIGVCTSAFAGCLSLSSAYFPECMILYDLVFNNCTLLSSISFPKLQYIGVGTFDHTPFVSSQYQEKGFVEYSNSYENFLIGVGDGAGSSFSGQHTVIAPQAFYGLMNMTNVNLPNCKWIDASTFAFNIRLSNINLPKCTYVDVSAFANCSSLTLINLPKCSYIGGFAFKSCISLSQITLLSKSICSLGNSNAFSGTLITSSTGSIFVLSSLVSIYKSNSTWSYFSDRIFNAWDTNPMTTEEVLETDLITSDVEAS